MLVTHLDNLAQRLGGSDECKTCFTFCCIFSLLDIVIGFPINCQCGRILKLMMMMVTSPPPAPDMSVADGLFLCSDPTFKRFSILAKGFYMQEGSIGFCLLRDFHILAHICTCYCSVLTPERDDAAGQPEYIQDDSLSDEKYFDKYS